MVPVGGVAERARSGDVGERTAELGRAQGVGCRQQLVNSDAGRGAGGRDGLAVDCDDVHRTTEKVGGNAAGSGHELVVAGPHHAHGEAVVAGQEGEDVHDAPVDRARTDVRPGRS